MVSQSANAEREDAITEVRRLRAEVEDLRPGWQTFAPCPTSITLKRTCNPG